MYLLLFRDPPATPERDREAERAYDREQRLIMTSPGERRNRNRNITIQHDNAPLPPLPFPIPVNHTGANNLDPFIVDIAGSSNVVEPFGLTPRSSTAYIRSLLAAGPQLAGSSRFQLPSAPSQPALLRAGMSAEVAALYTQATANSISASVQQQHANATLPALVAPSSLYMGADGIAALRAQVAANPIPGSIYRYRAAPLQQLLPQDSNANLHLAPSTSDLIRHGAAPLQQLLSQHTNAAFLPIASVTPDSIRLGAHSVQQPPFQYANAILQLAPVPASPASILSIQPVISIVDNPLPLQEYNFH